MRATLEYLAPQADPDTVSARLRYDDATGTITAGEGFIDFGDGAISTWRCGFDAEAVSIELTLSGQRGRISMENFVGEESAGGAGYRYWQAHEADAPGTRVRVTSPLSGPALMFRNFAVDARDPTQRERRIVDAERTQALLDAVRAADRRQ